MIVYSFLAVYVKRYQVLHIVFQIDIRSEIYRELRVGKRQFQIARHISFARVIVYVIVVVVGIDGSGNIEFLSFVRAAVRNGKGIVVIFGNDVVLVAAEGDVKAAVYVVIVYNVVDGHELRRRKLTYLQGNHVAEFKSQELVRQRVHRRSYQFVHVFQKVVDGIPDPVQVDVGNGDGFAGNGNAAYGTFGGNQGYIRAFSHGRKAFDVVRKVLRIKHLLHIQRSDSGKEGVERAVQPEVFEFAAKSAYRIIQALRIVIDKQHVLGGLIVMYRQHDLGIDVPAYSVIGFVANAGIDAARIVQVLGGYVASTFCHAADGGFGVHQAVSDIFEYDALINGRDLIDGRIVDDVVAVFLRSTVVASHHR